MIIFTTRCFDFPQSVDCFFVTWIMLFFLAYSTCLCFTILWGWGIDLSSLTKVYPEGFLKITRVTPNQNSVLIWAISSIPNQIQSFFYLCPLYSVHILLDCWLCLYQGHKLMQQNKCPFSYVFAYKLGNPFVDWVVDTTFSKTVYFTWVWFFIVISYIMTCFNCM